MRRIRKIEPEEESSIDLTPLLDIVFIMLIFFIVTATFTKESGITVNQAAAQTSKKISGQSVIIGLDAQNSIWLDGRNIDLRAVQINIARLRAENPKLSLIIAADRRSSTETLISVMDASRRAGIENISLAAKNE